VYGPKNGFYKPEFSKSYDEFNFHLDLLPCGLKVKRIDRRSSFIICIHLHSSAVPILFLGREIKYFQNRTQFPLARTSLFHQKLDCYEIFIP
jgi:hypothetical protein